MGFDFFKSHLLHDEKAYKKSVLEKERLERNLYKATIWDVFMYIEREGCLGFEVQRCTRQQLHYYSTRCQ